MDPNRIYTHTNPGTRIFGPGSLKRLPRVLAKGARPLLVTDKGLVRAGIVGKVAEVLEGAGIPVTVFDETPPDPPSEAIDRAAQLYVTEGCDTILALGGGSPMDAAKGLAVKVSHEGDVLDYCRGKAISRELPPLVAIPTTAGTGSEVTTVAVISDTKGKIKRMLVGSGLVPKVAILDPLLLAGLPPHIAAETGADALSHALEGLVTRAAQPLADALALHAIRLIAGNLRTMVADPSNVTAAGNMLLASTLASMCWTTAGLGLVHALAHPLGAHYHVSHGKACGLFLPLVMDFNLLACPDKYALAAQALGEDTFGLPSLEAARSAISAVEELFDDIGLPATYEELELEFELKEEMVEEVLSVPTRKANPRVSNREQIRDLFNAPG